MMITESWGRKGVRKISAHDGDKEIASLTFRPHASESVARAKLEAVLIRIERQTLKGQTND